MAEGRLKCPVDERGVPVVPEEFNVCYDVCLRGIKEVNRHHLLHPRDKYKTYPERHARENGGMIVQACICKHSDYHATYLPPTKPDRQVLVDIAQGDIQPVEAPVSIRTKELVNLENVS